MIPRTLMQILHESIQQYPVISVTGPRQSGKTTLCRAAFPDYVYFTLERPDNYEMVLGDPVGFLNRVGRDGVIIDEAQRMPELFSYIQAFVDESRLLGKIILTGSQNFLLSDSISQTLAGRVRILRLLPFSVEEISNNEEYRGKTIDEILFTGLYPPLYDRQVPPNDWYNNYIETYLERDVRNVKNITDLHQFQKFIGLCAGRIGQLLNMSSLASDLGVASHTVKSWLGVLEASYLIVLLQPHYNNLNKRIVRQPKLYFLDTGLACALAKIDSPRTLERHYLRGSLFENLAVTEYFKFIFNRGLPPNLYFWRDNHGTEIDMVIDNGALYAVEIKSGETFNGEMLKGLRSWKRLTGATKERCALLYGGKEIRFSPEAEIVSLGNLHAWFAGLSGKS